VSIVHVKQIAKKIKTLFEGKIDLSDKSLDKEITFLTRGLAAYAVQISAQTSEIESAKAVVDGFDDNGIDAIYYSTNNKTLYLVQSKWIQDGNGEPSTGDVSKFITGIKDLINGDYDKFNQKVQEKQNVVQSALTNFGTKIECIIIYTGKENLGRHNKRIIETLENELNDIGENNDDDLVKIAQFKQINQSEIYSTIAQGVEGEPINLELSLSQWGKVEEPIFAYFGMVSGIEIKQWYKQYNTRLFNKNIRKMLGNTEVNKEIENTIQNQPDKFWYFNNGITLIANDVTKNLIGGSSRDSGYFNATNISIVNGAQTVSTIGRLPDSEENTHKLERVKIPIRIISLGNASETFGSEVTKNNNRQNRIENRDFVSLDENQIRLKTELAIEGIEYNISRQEDFIPTEAAFDINEAVIALACASNQANLATQVKREIGKFYENLSKPPYTSIFNKSTTGLYVHYAVQCLRYVEQLIAKELTILPKKSGRAYGILVHGNRMLTLLTLSKCGIHQTKNSGKIALEQIQMNENFHLMKESLDREIANHYPDKLLGTLFKNQTICRELFDKIMNLTNHAAH
jgi:hypothetical protein